MVWKERSRVDERMSLIGEYSTGERAMTDLCCEFGISRKTAYKWVARYKEDGPAGLADRSRAPLTHSARLDPVVVQAVLEARREVDPAYAALLSVRTTGSTSFGAAMYTRRSTGPLFQEHPSDAGVDARAAPVLQPSFLEIGYVKSLLRPLEHVRPPFQ